MYSWFGEILWKYFISKHSLKLKVKGFMTRHFCTETGAAWDRTTNFLFSSWRALSPELQPPQLLGSEFVVEVEQKGFVAEARFLMRLFYFSTENRCLASCSPFQKWHTQHILQILLETHSQSSVPKCAHSDVSSQWYRTDMLNLEQSEVLTRRDFAFL